MKACCAKGYLGSEYRFFQVCWLQKEQKLEGSDVHSFLRSLCNARVLNRTMRTCYAVNEKQNANDWLVKFSPYERSAQRLVGPVCCEAFRWALDMCGVIECLGSTERSRFELALHYTQIHTVDQWRSHRAKQNWFPFELIFDIFQFASLTHP